MSGTVYQFTALDIKGEARSLEQFRGKVLLIVNTASKCGFTAQLAGLEELYQRYKDKGLVVLGFPCNQFGKQEPGAESEIESFCQKNYGVNFPMFSKIDVNGSDTHPLYEHLKMHAPGLLGSKAIKWNFTKFLVDRQGKVVARFAPKDTPQSLAGKIEELLQQEISQ